MNGNDPFASTSKALGRAAERRGQRSSDRRKSREDNYTSGNNNNRSSKSSSMTSTQSFDSKTQPPLPSRSGGGTNDGFPNTPSSSVGSKSSSRGNRGPSRGSRDVSLLDPKQPMASSRIASERLSGEKSVLDVLPPDYRYNPKTAAPNLYHLQKALEPKNGETKVDISLETLLGAADNDVRLHRARMQAGIEKGKPEIVSSQSIHLPHVSISSPFLAWLR